MIEPEVKSLGYELVRVAMIGGTSDPTLQVMAERPDTRQLDLSDCQRISRRLSEMLDLCDPIEGSYRLEVSSPGIDRPLTRLKDYQDWAGHEARITLAEPREGRKQYSGTIEGADDAEVERWDKHHALTPEEQRKAGKLEDRSRNTGQVLEAKVPVLVDRGAAIGTLAP